MVNTTIKHVIRAATWPQALCLAAVWAASMSMSAHLFAQTAPVGAKPATKSVAKAAQTKFDGAVALNKALRQPMLVERSTKAFLMISLKALVFRSQPAGRQPGRV